MLKAWSVLFSSRKFWVGTISVLAIVLAVLLRTLDKIPADALIPTISSITTLGLGVIGSIAWEDNHKPSPPAPNPNLAPLIETITHTLHTLKPPPPPPFPEPPPTQRDVG